MSNFREQMQAVFGKPVEANQNEVIATKVIEVWHVEYAVCGGSGQPWLPAIYSALTEAEAETHAQSIQNRRIGFEPATAMFRCVKVSGPHTHEIPA